MEDLSATFIHPNATVIFSQEGAGWLFSYAGDYQNHGWYGNGEGKPFPTRAAALAVAQDPDSVDVAEFSTGVQIWSI